MRVVVNTESDEREALGEFLGMAGDGDVVLYSRGPNVTTGEAPEDCVTIVEFTSDDVRAAFKRWRATLDMAESLIVGGEHAEANALNVVMAMAVEMCDFASVFGATATTSDAYGTLRREYREGRRVGTCSVACSVA